MHRAHDYYSFETKGEGVATMNATQPGWRSGGAGSSPLLAHAGYRTKRACDREKKTRGEQGGGACAPVLLGPWVSDAGLPTCAARHVQDGFDRGFSLQTGTERATAPV